MLGLENLRKLHVEDPTKTAYRKNCADWKKRFLSFNPQHPPVIRMGCPDIEKYFSVIPQTMGIEQLNRDFEKICKNPECFYFTVNKIDRNIPTGGILCLKALLDGKINFGTDRISITIEPCVIDA